MDLEFNSQEELYQRVLPALRAKCQELARLGLSYIREKDIWNYLILNKWRKAQDLQLSDIVSDIMHVDSYELDRYVKDMMFQAKRKREEENLEVI